MKAATHIHEDWRRLSRLERELRNGSSNEWEEYAALRQKLNGELELEDESSLDWMRDRMSKRGFRRARGSDQRQLPLPTVGGSGEEVR